MKSLITILVAATAAIATCQAWAVPEPDPLSITLTVHKVMVVNGQEKQFPADSAKPGDLLEYRAEYRNTGKTPTTQVKATVPVPTQGLEYLAGSASPQPVNASVDGRRYAAAPLMRTVTLPDGRRETQSVPATEYRYLQWNLGELAPGANAVVKARMKVTQPLAATLGNTPLGGTK